MQVSTLLARKLVLDVLKLYVRFNEGHHRVWRAMHICRRDHLFSRLYLLTGAKIPEKAQMWANGRILKRQQTIKEVQLNTTLFLSWLNAMIQYLPIYLAVCVNDLLFIAQAGLMGDCILKVALGKRAGIAAS